MTRIRYTFVHAAYISSNTSLLNLSCNKGSAPINLLAFENWLRAAGPPWLCCYINSHHPRGMFNRTNDKLKIKLQSVRRFQNVEHLSLRTLASSKTIRSQAVGITFVCSPSWYKANSLLTLTVTVNTRFTVIYWADVIRRTIPLRKSK